MYLTVFKMTRDSILNSKHPLNIKSGNAVHQLLTARQDASRAEGKILYKIIETGDEIYLYVQSKDKFNREGIENRGLVFVKEIRLDYDSVLGVYEFDVQVFPNYLTEQGKRYFIKDPGERYKWLYKQFQRKGITLLSCKEYKMSDITVDRDKSVLVRTTSYRGQISIDDCNQAKELFENGIGRMKNYGLGLVLIK